jgi:DNA-3-methyladenine glycosylase I
VSTQKRCFGNSDLYNQYHDEEWGVPVHDDRKLFEFLILEGAQAGLSWETVLKRREGYRACFHHFDPIKVAVMSDAELEALRQDERIIRNRLKIAAARQNARVFLEIQKEFGSFDHYLWKWVDGKPIVTRAAAFTPKTPLSDAISKDLKKRGMTFVGSTIIYAFLQAVGVVDDHLLHCWRA